MGRISNTFQATGVTAGVIIVIYKTTAPASEVARLYRAGPQTTPWNFVFADIVDGVYIVRIHETTDGTTLGLMRHDYWQDAITNQILAADGWFDVAGGGPTDPADGATSQIDASRAGKIVRNLFQEGFRFLKPGVECDLSDPTEIKLLGGRTFAAGSRWYYELAESVTSASPVAAGDYATIEEFSGNKVLANTDAGKTWMFTASGTTQVTTLPLLSTVSDGDGFVIVHDGGPVINVELAVSGGDVIRFRGNDKNKLYLGKGELVKVIKKGIKWRVVNSIGQWDQVGSRIGVDKQPDNALIADGSLIDGNIYKRLYEFVTSLPAGQQISLTTWAGSPTKQRFFAVNTSSKIMRLPDMRGMTIRGLKNIGSTDTERPDNIPGGFQAWSVGPHQHDLPADQAGISDLMTVWNNPNSDEGFDGGHLTAVNNPGGENRVDNVGLLPIVLI